ncbi:MAG: hypothetical protein ACXVA9_11065 [Bdellovibrionales bacterium]
MKPLNLNCIAFSLMIAVFAPLAGLNAQGPRTVNLGIAHIVVPDNLGAKEIVVVAAGNLPPNGCQRWDSYSINHESAYVHVLSARAKFKEFCAGTIWPFAREINLGNLEPGVHTIKYMDENLQAAEFTFEVKAN